MGNESSKKASSKLNKSKEALKIFKSGPSSSTVQNHLENAKKSRVLQLKNCGIKTVPPAIEEVATILRNIDLSDNKIREIPEFFVNLSALKSLHLANNSISILPEEMGSLKALEFFNISNNQLTQLPDTLIGCLSLKIINLSGNQFVEFPAVLNNLPNIEFIDLSANVIEVIPEDVSHLQAVELNLNKNRLRLLHQNLAKCARLKILRVEENCLDKTQFSQEILANSHISLISFSGNLFQYTEFQHLPGYDDYQERYTAIKRKAA